MEAENSKNTGKGQKRSSSIGMWKKKVNVEKEFRGFALQVQDMDQTPAAKRELMECLHTTATKTRRKQAQIEKEN